MTIIEELENQVKENPILLYMKGSPEAPQCGFSSKASQILIACGKPFSFVDILSNPEIRANLPQFSKAPVSILTSNIVPNESVVKLLQSKNA